MKRKTSPVSNMNIAENRGRGRPADPRRRAAKSAAMLAAASKLFAEKGYDQVSIEEIAKEAGQSKGAFYWYFKNKEFCLKRILDEQKLQVATAFAKALAPNHPASKRLLALSDFRHWGSDDFIRFIKLLRGLTHSRSKSTRGMAHLFAAEWFSGGHDLIFKLGKEAAKESGWTENHIKKFDFKTWAFCYMACYDGIFSLVNQETSNFIPRREHMAKMIHESFIFPILKKETDGNAES